VEDYRGAKIIWHGGAVLGFKTAVVLLPGRKVGFAITINSEEGELIRGLMFELLDHYLGFPTSDWPARFKAYRATQFAEGLKAVEAAKTKPAKVGPTLPLRRYAGTYTDAWYGNVEVVSGANGLAIDFKSTPNMTGRLQHWQYNTFVTRFTDRSIEPAYVTFSVSQDGKVDRVTMKAASPVADFSWDYHDLLFTPE
jgi:hypothetical protein